jgi:hypothetical protein
MCVVCEGRIHLPGCTSRRNRLKDCCPARHKMLFDQGHTRGLDDSSYVMWSPEHPGGYHPNDIRKIDKEPQ